MPYCPQDPKDVGPEHDHLLPILPRTTADGPQSDLPAAAFPLSTSLLPNPATAFEGQAQAQVQVLSPKSQRGKGGREAPGGIGVGVGAGFRGERELEGYGEPFAPPKPKVMEYLPKLVQIILKSRVSLPGVAKCPSGELQQHSDWPRGEEPEASSQELFESWRVGDALHIVISLNQHEEPVVLERWTLQLVPSGKREISYLPLDGISNAEKTEFVLLIQSLYGHVRTMPLSELIAKRDIEKDHLSHRVSLCEEAQSRTVHPFSRDAKDIQRHIFNSAEMSFGTFTLSVQFLSKQEIVDQVLGAPPHEADPVMSQSIPTKNGDSEEEHFRKQLERGLSGVFEKELEDDAGVPWGKSWDYREGGGNGDFSETGAAFQSGSKAKPIRINTSREPPNAQSFGSPIPSPKSHSSLLSFANMKYLKGKQEVPRGERPSFASSFGNLEDGSNPSSAPIQIAPIKSRPSFDFADDYQDEDSEIANPAPITKFKPSPRPTSSWSRRESGGHELFGSLLGSYEESILNGRMSTTPSKPIEFVAELGVLGKGKCKPSLKCPPHAVFNFQAFFYQLKEHDTPTPYVGTIDLQNCLAPDSAPQLHPGFYRIPPKGILQLIVKNPNKTVVKIFLVHYDFSDMPASTKTFLRQTSHSTEEMNALKYAIHMKVFCNNRRKLYLHSTIRVVFSHRVPDGSEKLKVTTKKSDEYIPLNTATLASPTEEDF